MGKNARRKKKYERNIESSFKLGKPKLSNPKYLKYLCFIFIVGLIVFFPVLFNGFVWDYIPGIVNYVDVHSLNLPLFFGQNLSNSLFYRPLESVYTALVYVFFGPNPFVFHLIQLSLHLVDAYLLFLIFCLFFTEEISLFLALIFFVHPINAESVMFISAMTNQLYFTFGMAAFIVAKGKKLTTKQIIFMSLFLLLSIFSKEVGFLFFLIILLYRYVFKLNTQRGILLSELSIVSLYALIRTAVGGVSEVSYGYPIPIQSLSFLQRLFNIPAIVMYYLKTFLFPLQLAIWQHWVIQSVSVLNFVLPLVLCLILLLFSAVATYLLYQSDKKQIVDNRNYATKGTMLIASEPKNSQMFLFFFFWFILGTGMSIQIVPLDMTVADRWFYFPIVGLLGMTGVGLTYLQQTFKRFTTQYYAIALIILCLLSLRTFIRAFDWKNNLTLYTHDIQYQKDNYIFTDALARELLLAHKPDEALPYELESVAIQPTIINETGLGEIYLAKFQLGKAIDAFVKGEKLYNPNTQSPRFQSGLRLMTDIALEENYGKLSEAYIFDNRPTDAITLLNTQTLRQYPTNSRDYDVLAIAYDHIHNHAEALKAAAKAYELSSNPTTQAFYNAIQDNQPVDLSRP